MISIHRQKNIADQVDGGEAGRQAEALPGEQGDPARPAGGKNRMGGNRGGVFEEGAHDPLARTAGRGGVAAGLGVDGPHCTHTSVNGKRPGVGAF